jgi:membrane-associated protease RseP (regulator of RpoE activity)
MLTPIGIALIVFILYWVAVEVLKRRGILERYKITAIGPILMIRTSKGLRLLDKLARWKKFWRVFADLGLPAVFAGMAFMFALILFTDFIIFTKPPEPSPLTNPKNALLLPGINDFIPLLWGLIGLIVTLVVHEFSHAILCRVEGIRVKALGVLLTLIPIGGFAEPDEEELMDREKTARIQRIRIFSAGVVSNFAVAAISFATFFYLLNFVTPLAVVTGSDIPGIDYGDAVLKVNGISVRTPQDVYSALGDSKNVTVTIRHGEEIKDVTVPNVMGVKIIGLYREDNRTFPAETAGIKENMVIFRINNTPIRTPLDFQKKMSELKPGETISVYVYDNNTIRVFNLTLASMNGKGFMGVYIQTTDYIGGLSIGYSHFILNELKGIPEMLKSIEGWLYMIAMPFRFQGFSGAITNFFEAPEYIYWLLNIFYWIGWINFYVGLFNCLPAVPLDGGRVFHEAFSYLLSRKYKEKADEMSMKVVKTFAFIVFTSILLSILIPNLPRV